MKITNHTVRLLLAATLGAATSCSDFNDWNSVQEDGMPSAEKTLWENLSENPQLANFRQIVEAAGIQADLQANRYYTIWAPELTDAQRDSVLALDSKAILEQFVNNHIAEYNHQATGIISKRIHTLNDKAYNFVGENGVYTFNSVSIVKPNIPNKNGTLHILKSNSPFLPNAYQSMWMANDVDSLSKYFKKYELTTLDENQSVPGPMVNGKQTYIDSVFVTANTMTQAIRAKLESEDSLYTFIMPNNEAYKKLYDKIASLYNYVANVQAQDVANSTSATSYTTLTAPNMDMSLLKDSLIRREIVNNLAFSHYDKYNARYFEGVPYVYKGEGEPEDTILSTYRNKFSEPEKILDPEHIVETIQLSNGQAIIVDSLMFKSWETFNPQRTVRGTNAARYLNGTRVNYEILNADGSYFTSEDGTRVNYICVTPNSSFGKPEVDYYLPNILSGTYRIYAVMPPPLDTPEEMKPNWLNFTLNYYDSKRTRLTDFQFTNERYDADNNVIITYNQNTGAEVRTTIKNTDFFNDPTKIDTLYLGEFTFPCCYAGIGEYYPNIKVTIPSTYSTLASRGHTAAYDRTIRICSIILRPVEYDKYLKNEEE